MATNEHIYERLTYKYNESHKENDRWAYRFPAVSLGGRTTRKGIRDVSDGPTSYFRVIVPGAAVKEYGRTRVRQMLAEHYSGGDTCYHEHDCCGCSQWRAAVRKTSRRREFLVRVSVSYNY